jgi:hypothetical protein
VVVYLFAGTTASLGQHTQYSTVGKRGDQEKKVQVTFSDRFGLKLVMDSHHSSTTRRHSMPLALSHADRFNAMKFRSLLAVVSFAPFRVHAFELPKCPCGLKSAHRARAEVVRPRAKSGAPTVTNVITPQRGASDVVGDIEVRSGESPIKCLDVAICGGGPAGLLSAIMMAQQFPLRKTVVFDRLPRPPSPDDNAVWADVGKFYLIGIGGRGQNALKRFGVWDEVAKRGVPILGRKGASRLTLR